MIGTTDTRVDEPFTEVTDDDRDFLLDQINRRLDLRAAHPRRRDRRALWRAAAGGEGVVVRGDRRRTQQRHVDWTSLSRKHAIETDAGGGW